MLQATPHINTPPQRPRPPGLCSLSVAAFPSLPFPGPPASFPPTTQLIMNVTPCISGLGDHSSNLGTYSIGLGHTTPPPQNTLTPRRRLSPKAWLPRVSRAVEQPNRKNHNRLKYWDVEGEGRGEWGGGAGGWEGVGRGSGFQAWLVRRSRCYNGAAGGVSGAEQ